MMHLFSRSINQVFAGLVFALALLIAAALPARAHEIRPAIVDLVFAGDGAVRL